MEEKHNVVFVTAGSGSIEDKEKVARGIAGATKQPVDKILKRVANAPFVYKREISLQKAQTIAKALERLGAVVEIQRASSKPPPSQPAGAPEGAVAFDAPPQDFDRMPSAPSPTGDAPAFEFKLEGTLGLEERAPVEPPGGFMLGDAGEPAQPDQGGLLFKEEIVSRDGTEGEAEIPVERNIDYGTTQPGEEGAVRPPPRPVPDAEPEGELIECPRCGHEQPFVRECVSCGVIIEKAGEAQKHLQATPGTGRRAKKASGFKAWLLVIPLLLVGLVASYFLGVFRPLEVKLRTSLDPLLKEFDARLTGGSGEPLVIRIEEGAKAGEVQSALLDSSKRIREEIAALDELQSVEAFDAARSSPEFEARMAEYRSLDAFKLRARALDIVSSDTGEPATGWSLGGSLITTDKHADKFTSGLLASVIEPAFLDSLLEESRSKVAATEERINREKWLVAVNSDLAESFNGGSLDERWRWTHAKPGGFAVSRGKASWTSEGLDVAGEANTASLLYIDEPTRDYTLETTVTFVGGNGSARAGILIFKDEDNFIEGMLASRPGGRSAVFGVETEAEYREMISKGSSGRLALRITKKGVLYRWEIFDARARKWSRVTDYFPPPWDKDKPGRIGLAASGETGVTFAFERFHMTVRR